MARRLFKFYDENKQQFVSVDDLENDGGEVMISADGMVVIHKAYYYEECETIELPHITPMFSDEKGGE